MNKIEITTQLLVFEDVAQLPQNVQELFLKATEIRKKAYAPYSKFKVGAAILLENGQVILGSNQENAAYPSGLCAERVAIFQASALYTDVKILKMVITAGADNGTTNKPIPPCGACRQSIAEYEIKQEYPIEVFFKGETGIIYKSGSIADLLPLMFTKDSL